MTSLKEALWEEAIASLRSNRENLLRIREHVQTLLEEQEPLRIARREAIVRGDSKEAQRLFEEIRRIGVLIQQVNQNAQVQLEAAKDTVREALEVKDE